MAAACVTGMGTRGCSVQQVMLQHHWTLLAFSAQASPQKLAN